MGPLIFGIVGFGLGWLFSSSGRREERQRHFRTIPAGGCFPGGEYGLRGRDVDPTADSRTQSGYGAVTLWMGGRGTGAGSGASSQMGGRTTVPYAYESPSSVVTNWNKGSVFGGDGSIPHMPVPGRTVEHMGLATLEELQRIDRIMNVPIGPPSSSSGPRASHRLAVDEYGFVIPILNVPVGPASRAKHLSARIQAAKSKLSELEAEAKSLRDDDSALDQISLRIAKVQGELERLQEKYDRVAVRAGGSVPAGESDEDFGSVFFNEEKLLARRRTIKRELRELEEGSPRYMRLRKILARIERRLKNHDVDFGGDEEVSLFRHSIRFD